jgi:thiol-disulfide isomerase/thioredoxin
MPNNREADRPEGAPDVKRSAALRISLVLVTVFAVAAILYATLSRSGKESAQSESTQSAARCTASTALAAKVAPLARGEVAGLIVSKAPAPAVDLTFSGPDGADLKLSSFRGRAILLNLWATWCLPCRAEMPALDRLQAALGGADFEVVAVNIDTARLERRQAFLKEAGVERLAFYADPTANVFQVLKRAAKATGLPTTILIDSEGCELGIMSGPAEWDSEDALRLIKAMLGEN